MSLPKKTEFSLETFVQELNDVDEKYHKPITELEKMHDLVERGELSPAVYQERTQLVYRESIEEDDTVRKSKLKRPTLTDVKSQSSQFLNESSRKLRSAWMNIKQQGSKVSKRRSERSQLPKSDVSDEKLELATVLSPEGIKEMPIMEGNLLCFAGEEQETVELSMMHVVLYKHAIVMYEKKDDVSSVSSRFNLSVDSFIGDSHLIEKEANLESGTGFVLNDFAQVPVHFAGSAPDVKLYWMHAIARVIRKLQDENHYFQDAPLSTSDIQNKSQEQLEREFREKIDAYNRGKGAELKANGSRRSSTVSGVMSRTNTEHSLGGFESSTSFENSSNNLVSRGSLLSVGSLRKSNSAMSFGSASNLKTVTSSASIRSTKTSESPKSARRISKRSSAASIKSASEESSSVADVVSNQSSTLPKTTSVASVSSGKLASKHSAASMSSKSLASKSSFKAMSMEKPPPPTTSEPDVPPPAGEVETDGETGDEKTVIVKKVTKKKTKKVVKKKKPGAASSGTSGKSTPTGSGTKKTVTKKKTKKKKKKQPTMATPASLGSSLSVLSTDTAMTASSIATTATGMTEDTDATVDTELSSEFHSEIPAIREETLEKRLSRRSSQRHADDTTQEESGLKGLLSKMLEVSSDQQGIGSKLSSFFGSITGSASTVSGTRTTASGSRTESEPSGKPLKSTGSSLSQQQRTLAAKASNMSLKSKTSKSSLKPKSSKPNLKSKSSQASISQSHNCDAPVAAVRYNGTGTSSTSSSTQGASLKDLAAMWNNKVEERKPAPTVYRKPNTDGYGRAPPGSKSEARAAAAAAWVDKEITKLLEVLEEMGKHDPEEGGICTVEFGPLFVKYQDVSDTLVGILMRAKKRKHIKYKGDMLFQGYHDTVKITLLKRE